MINILEEVFKVWVNGMRVILITGRTKNRPDITGSGPGFTFDKLPLIRI